MKVVVVGNGGREHAIAWKLLQSPQVEEVYCTPGNAGTALLEGCQNLPVDVDDFSGIAQAASALKAAFVLIGPERPLAKGIVDFLKQYNVPAFGPPQAAAKIESSKSWAKTLMEEAGIPTAESAVFEAADAAKAYIEQKGAPIVVKANGLAAGKGVVVAETVEEAKDAVDSLFENRMKAVVIEERLKGQEVSILSLMDGQTIRPLLPAQDHKRIGEGEQGTNTGGMGAYSPVPWLIPELMERIEQEILQPTLKALQARGLGYRGVLYSGLMILPDGTPKVLEYNCRFGDPETQVLMALLETPLEDLVLACIEQRLADLPPIAWKNGAALCAIVASQGYPEVYQKGYEISGLDTAAETGALIFHSGTELSRQGKVLTDAGRVLGITATGDDFDRAAKKVYAAISRIKYQDMYYRRDIGFRVRKQMKR